MARARAFLAAVSMLAVTLAPGPASPQASADAGVEVSTWVNATVTIDTNFGVIVGMLYEQGAPITTSNFINLSTSGFYDGIKFHRIVDNFVIQTGDPNSKDNNPYNDGMGGSGTTIPLEINANLTHEDGAFGMARSSDPNSASSQFYICDGPQHQLDGNYSVFAIVVEGIEVVRTIAAQPVWGYKRPLLMQHPIGDIVMNTVVVSLGYWNNTTLPGSQVGGGGLFGLGTGGSAALVFVVLAAAVGVGTSVSPPFRARVAPLAAKIPKPAAVAARLKRLVPRRAPRG